MMRWIKKGRAGRQDEELRVCTFLFPRFVREVRRTDEAKHRYRNFKSYFRGWPSAVVER
jgi:hypothetical protein